MSGANRIAGKGRLTPAKTARFTFDGKSYTALEGDYSAADAQPFLDRRGRVLHNGGREFRNAAEIEGSARLADGRVINIVGESGRPRWRVVNAAYGIDTRGCPLVPFRSAAVDPRIIPLGSILHIPSTVGVRVPGGGRHDGTWYAVDVGSQIRGQHVDLFTGFGINSMSRFRDGPNADESTIVTVTGALPVRRGERTRCLP